MEDRFHNLEMQLADQLNVIKTMLLNMEDKIVEQDQFSRQAQRRIMGTIFKQCPSAASTQVSNRNGQVLNILISICKGGKEFCTLYLGMTCNDGLRSKYIQELNVAANTLPHSLFLSCCSRPYPLFYGFSRFDYSQLEL
jgi:uncharacterized coiled-coil protein SlyX